MIIPPGEEAGFKGLLGDGSQMGVHIEYKVQTVARGIADAFLAGARNLLGLMMYAWCWAIIFFIIMI